MLYGYIFGGLLVAVAIAFVRWLTFNERPRFVVRQTTDGNTSSFDVYFVQEHSRKLIATVDSLENAKTLIAENKQAYIAQFGKKLNDKLSKDIYSEEI